MRAALSNASAISLPSASKMAFLSSERVESVSTRTTPRSWAWTSSGTKKAVCVPGSKPSSALIPPSLGRRFAQQCSCCVQGHPVDALSIRGGYERGRGTPQDPLLVNSLLPGTHDARNTSQHQQEQHPRAPHDHGDVYRLVARRLEREYAGCHQGGGGEQRETPPRELGLGMEHGFGEVGHRRVQRGDPEKHVREQLQGVERASGLVGACQGRRGVRGVEGQK